jgi:hypothetical protein
MVEHGKEVNAFCSAQAAFWGTPEQLIAADRIELAFHRKLVARCRCLPAAEFERSAVARLL